MTGSGMIVYGAYLDDRENLVNAARATGAFDTLAAIIAGLVIIPTCFSYGIDVAGGPGLLYVVMPRVLQTIPFGKLFAVFIYFAIILAGVTSLQNMYEAVVESTQHHFPKLSRPVLLTLLCVICLAIGVNIEAIPRWGPLLDFTSIYIIPIGATIGAVSWFWIMKKEDLLAEVNKSVKKPHGNGWYYTGKYAYVFLAILLCIIALVKQIAF
jgi:NSS family neurotransmitter:Na+ symporter